MSLYEVLGIDKTATVSQIKAAHHKLAAKYHPDKVKGMENKFQEMQTAYTILSDLDRRDRYDRTGRFDDIKVTPQVVQLMVEQMITAIVMTETPDGREPDDPTWENIKNKILNTILNGRRECQANLKRQHRFLKRLENIAKRFKSKTDADPVGDAFAARRILLTQELHKFQDGLELSFKTEEVFRGYDYVVGEEVETEPEGHLSPASTRRLSGPRYITEREAHL